ncbi:MAG: putative DNA binding domain-containing protein [Nevskiaceae bacterium]|nr:putative DNA binding domain-containing protein [Nevskiaceae bacterium]
MTSRESHHLDRKSLRLVTGSKTDFDALAQDCVCFANAVGGTLLIGVENDTDAPPASQRIVPSLLDRIRKRVGELTVNVQVAPELKRHENGGEYIALIVPRAQGVASTSDGRYFLRVGDTCRPIVGDDVMRLANERPATPWEMMTSLGVQSADADSAKVIDLCARLRASDRVKASVKEKTNDELLAHYALAAGNVLTNLGVLLVGGKHDCANLGSAPIVQAIKYDEREVKVAKWCWDDWAQSPIELIDAIWEGIPDFRESYEIPDGMFRTQLPAYDKLVVRELLVNAFVHRPYTQRGDIYLNLHPDRLEVVNPGRLPIGVTPQNILHESRRRNDGLTRIFHDLKLMEREGSGIDLLFERLLASGRQRPTIREGIDSVHVTVSRRVIQPGVVNLLAEADRRYSLTQRERITFALIAQTEGIAAVKLGLELELPEPAALRPWLGRLLTWGLIEQSGRTSATRYFVPPGLLRNAGLDALTTLTRVQPHRLRALILEDLERFPDSSKADIWRRVGPEIPERTFRRALEELVESGRVTARGETRARRFNLKPGVSGHEGHGVQ